MPDFEVPSIYLRNNFQCDDRLAIVLIDRGSGEVRQKFATAEKIASAPFQAHLRAANASGKDVYISMNTVAPEAAGRTKADVETIRHIYLDIDMGGRAAVDKILNADGMPNPHHVLNTSPDKYQVVWRVEGFEKAAAENTLRGLAAQHGADPAVTDCSRVLRLPGFRNCKYEQPHYVKDTHENLGGRIYGPGDFPTYELERLAVILNEPRQYFGRNGQTSQSERDWSYALRALERGESPTSIEAKIEQFRQDKPNPRYYAHRTVSRAVMARAGSVSRSAAPASAESNVLEPGGIER